MNQYEVIIHYVIPSRHGGIQSAIHRVRLQAPNEEKAEQAAIISGVPNHNYLYTNMVETRRIFQ